jgi:eukaryotic-like serine/threonine-protein kinase
MAATPADRLIANRYALKTALRRSAMGTVWHAQDTLLGREVAVKEVQFPPVLAKTERRRAQAWVMREATATARFNHPGVVTLFDVVKDQSAVFIVTELVHAPTLADLVRAEGPLPPLRVAEIGAAVASVLEAVHSAGVVHRGLKPANVLVQRDGGVRLVDFGVASLEGAPHVAASGLAIGSPSYVAPEQARGESSGPAADMWALGATMYFAVEGEPPFEKSTLTGTLAAVVNEDPRPMLRAGPAATLITALLAKDPDDRLSAPRVRVWLRWLVDVARPAPFLKVLPEQSPGGRVPLPSSPSSSIPQPTGPPVAATAPSVPTPLEVPASEPVKVPDEESSTGTAPVQPRTGLALLPASPFRRPARGWLAPVLLLVVVAGLLVASLASASTQDRAGEERAAPATTRGDAGATAMTQPVPSTTKKPATTQASRTPATAAVQGQLPGGWRAFTNRAGNNRVGVPPGFRPRTRQRYHATVVEEESGARRLFTVRSQNPSALLPQASRDYRAWARRNLAGFREVRYDEDQTYAGRPGAVVLEYEATRGGRRVHVRHVNVKGRGWGYNVELIVPATRWDASQDLARQFEQAFQPLG